MAEDKVDLESVLALARDKERGYDWRGAVTHRLRAIELLSGEEVLKAAEVQEAIAYDLYRAAFQSDDIAAFRKGIDDAVGQYERARTCYSRSGGQSTLACANRCEAMIALSSFWVSKDSSQRKDQLEKAWNLTRQSLNLFDACQDSQQYGTTYIRLVIAAAFLECCGDKLEYRENVVREALTFGDKAIRNMQRTDHPTAAAEIYTAMAYFLQAWIDDYVGPGEEEKYSLKASQYFSKGHEISEEASLVCHALLYQIHSYPDSVPLEDAIDISEKAVKYANATGDKYLTGRALENLARLIYWRLASVENPDERRSLATKALQILLESQLRFKAIDFLSSCTCGCWGVEPYGSHYWWMCEMGSETEEKKALAEQASEHSADYLDLAKKSGFSDNWGVANYVVGSSLLEMARAEDDLVEKKNTLKRAIEYLEVCSNYDSEVHPRNYWFRGLDHGRRALAESELARLTEDPAEKADMFRKTLNTRLRGLDLYSRTAEGTKGESQIFLTEFAGFLYNHGMWCCDVYRQTNEEEYLNHALEALEKAVKYYSRADTPTRAAEVCWRLAELQDEQNEYLKASESYSASASLYESATERVPGLKEFYADHEHYLQAWSHIEQARYHHSRQEPAAAMEDYRKAAELHESTKRWGYLSRNYLAWSEVENAENLSRKDENESAIMAFEKAGKLFKDSLKAVKKQLPLIDDLETRQMANRLVKAAAVRIDYCKSRQILEEGRILYKKGEASASSEKYALAAEAFDKMLASLESDHDRKDIALTATLSKAWERLARAEAESSHELYRESSRLFEEAKDLSEGEKGKALVIGHSRLCMALEAGTRFSDTGDLDFRDSARAHLDAAAMYYLKAGAKGASDHAKASGLLFDAYAHMNEAGKEKDHAKKAKLYTMAEKVLQASASSFSRANQLGKEKQVLLLLEKVREERELALSLNDILRAPDVMSKTMVFSSFTPSLESSAGLDRFEHADIQATLVVRPRDLQVGQDFNLEIDLVNAGKGAAQLMKVEEVVPRGFDVVKEPEKYRIEDSYLNMRGKRLDALKTEDVRVVLKPNRRGRFTLKPRVLYLDESGKSRFYEPEPIVVSIKEFGISGWLRGPENTR